MSIELHLLGDLAVIHDDRPVAIPRGMRQRLLLALAVDRTRSISDDDLIDRLWGGAPPTNALASLRNNVSRLRAELGNDAIQRSALGYRLGAACALDTEQFEALVATARRHLAADELDEATSALEAALTLVRGPVLAQVADEWWARPLIDDTDEQVALAEELWAEIHLRQGHTTREIVRLHEAARRLPHREVRWRHTMRALADAGRRTEALRVSDEATRTLGQFGMQPGPELRDLERELLGAPAGTSAPGSSVTSQRLDGARRWPLVGRAQLVDELRDEQRVVWLSGEPGIGKTRVLAELAATAGDRGELVLYGACERSATAGTQLIVDLARDALQASRGAAPVPAELAVLLGHDDFDDRDTHHDLDVRRARLRSGVLRLLTAAAERQPVLVLADDVHWIDEAAADFVLHLVERTPTNVRWMFASRPHPDRSGQVHLRSALLRRTHLRDVLVEPLDRDQVRRLVEVLAPDSAASVRAAIAREASNASNGNVLFAVEVIGHRLAHPDDRGTPPRLEAIVDSMLDNADADERDLVTTLAVAGRQCPPRLVAAALGLGIDDLFAVAQRLVARGVLATPTAAGIEFRHDVIAEVVAAGLALPDEMAARRRLVAAAARDDRHVDIVAEHLVALGPLVEPEQIEQRHRAVAAAISALERRNEIDVALALGRRYVALGAGDDADASPAAVAATVRVATALLAHGDAAAGRELLQRIAPRVQAIGDPVLRTDALLALGPVQTGSSAGDDDAATEAEFLLGELPEQEIERRVQLAMWAAHHYLNRGERSRAVALLDRFDDVDLPANVPYMRGLLLAIRAQAEAMSVCGSGPDGAKRAVATLADYAKRTGDESSQAGAAVLAVGAAFMFGTVADVRRARDAVEQSAQRLPRPDMRWWPLAIDVAVLLATGDLDVTSLAIERAETHGQELGVTMARGTALLHRSQHMLLSGSLGGLRDLLAATVDHPDTPPVMIATYGLACVEADDVEGARRAAALLRPHLPLLSPAGISWANLAMAASAVAHAAGDAVLGRSLWDEMVRWSGAGLCLSGAAYFGTVDHALGLCALAMGRGDDGIDLLRRAEHQERVRGATAWERRVQTTLERITR